MEELTLEQMHQYGFDMLLHFKKFCASNSLTFFLAYGTLLGSVRHHGFIPWDDDIDVCMPRPDYEKLLNLTTKNQIMPDAFNERYCIKSIDNGLCLPFARVFDNWTRVEQPFYSERKCGGSLWIDIFPIDGLPDSTRKTACIYKWKQNIMRIIRLQNLKIGRGRNKVFAACMIPLSLISRIIPAKILVWLHNMPGQKYPFANSKQVGIASIAAYGKAESIKKSYVENPATVIFEHNEFTSFSCWDEYLSAIYGNYMQFPSDREILGKRHAARAWYIGNSL